MVIFLDVSRIISEGGKITVLAQITNRLYCSLRFLVKVAKYPLLAQILSDFMSRPQKNSIEKSEKN